jgi:hypothetical protein
MGHLSRNAVLLIVGENTLPTCLCAGWWPACLCAGGLPVRSCHLSNTRYWQMTGIGSPHFPDPQWARKFGVVYCAAGGAVLSSHCLKACVCQGWSCLAFRTLCGQESKVMASVRPCIHSAFGSVVASNARLSVTTSKTHMYIYIYIYMHICIYAHICV